MENQDIIENILVDTGKKVEGRMLYNYVEKSASAEFYHNQFAGSIHGVKSSAPDYSKVPNEMKMVMDFFSKNVSKEAIIVELGGSKHQNRSGYPNYIFKNYIPLDISYGSMEGYVDMYGRAAIVADACKLPFKDQSIDAIFTHTFLEHPLNPNNVLSEIDRVLKPGGFVIHSDAWNCRWWQRYGIVGVKKPSQMSLKELTIYFSAKITEFKLIRFPIIVAERFFRLILISTKKPVELSYKKLTPNYSLSLFIDEDAASSIDPVSVMLFYESRGYKCLPSMGFVDRLFFKNMNIYFQKLK